MERIAFHSCTTPNLLLEDDLQLARETKYSGIVATFEKIQQYLETNNQKELKQTAKDSGVAIFGISGISVDLFVPDMEMVKTIKRHARLVRAMKGNFISIVPLDDAAAQTDRNRTVEQYVSYLSDMAEAASEYDVNLLIEPQCGNELLSNPVDLSFIFSKAGKNNLGFVFDVFTLYRSGVMIEEFETIERDFYSVYVADVPDKQHVEEKDRVMLGQGILDFERIFRIIKNCDYRGVYTVKMFFDFRTKQRNKTLLADAREHVEAFLNTLQYI